MATTTTSPTSTKAPADSTTAKRSPNAPSSGPTEKEIDTATSALNHFSQGKRHLLVGDFKSAVSSFQEASMALAGLYGEQAPECGDAYYHYGRALLELARREAGVLGPDLDGGSSQEGSTEEEDDEEEEEESEESQEEDSGKEKEGGKEEEEGEEGKEETEDKKEKKEAGPEEGEGENTEEEDEMSTLQCAWEWLEVSRVIFDKQESTPEIAKKRAQVCLSLGEVCLESEDYSGAISDFKKCLEIQKSVLAEDDRCLAETHYQLGLAHSFSDEFDEAVASFRAATEVIELKIQNLKARIKEKLTWTKEQRDKAVEEMKDVFYTEEGEIEELNQLLPDIQYKITDMEEMKKASTEKLQQVAKALMLGKNPSGEGAPEAFSLARGSGSSTAGGSSGASGAGTSKFSEAKAIPCMVRRKQRKPEDGPAEEQKKPRLENGVKETKAVTPEPVPAAQDKAAALAQRLGGEPAKSAAETSPPAKLIAVKTKATKNGCSTESAPSPPATASSTTPTEDK